jgi:predicted ATPase
LRFDHQLLMGCVLDKFTDAEKNVIKCAAVIGEEFSLDLLVCILAPFLLGELEDLLLSLVDGGVIFRMADGVFSFRSSLVRGFTYSLIPPT